DIAHQQSRKADRLLAAGKYEEAISCHRKAAGEYNALSVDKAKTQTSGLVYLLLIPNV
uniref:Nuclear receptor-binding factor 2 MIT domain-containing protein n=1 Tax=Pavo cristatus TaxID=9049 RepID=A0A8C9EKH3_PAVCR